MSRSRKNPRFVKVKKIIPSEYVKELLVNSLLNSSSTQALVKFASSDIRKDFSVIQTDILSSTLGITKILEKVIFISLVSLVVSIITLILSFC